MTAIYSKEYYPENIPAKNEYPENVPRIMNAKEQLRRRGTYSVPKRQIIFDWRNPENVLGTTIQLFQTLLPSHSSICQHPTKVQAFM
jgi:hypothetical protein